MANELFEIKTNITRNMVGKKLFEMEQKYNRRIETKIKESIVYVRNKIAEFAPIRTGNLRNRILSLPITGVRKRGFKLIVGQSGSISVSLSLDRRKDKKILWADQGTGVYGPFGKPIKPRSSEFLQFKIDGRFVRAKVVEGQKPQHFIKNGIRASKLVVASKIKSAFR